MKNTKTEVKTKKGMSNGKKVAMAGAAAATVAGAYMLLGPDGKKNQKKAKLLMSKVEKEVKSKVKTAKNLSAPLYHKAVDAVMADYGKQYQEYGSEIKAVAKKLKGEWKKATTTNAKPRAKTTKKK